MKRNISYSRGQLAAYDLMFDTRPKLRIHPIATFCQLSSPRIELADNASTPAVFQYSA
jgi:hypothetical protein